MYKLRIISIFTVIIFSLYKTFGQIGDIKWSNEGNSFYTLVKNEIVKNYLPDNSKEIVLNEKQLTPGEGSTPIKISHYVFSSDQKKVLLFTKTKKVWRLNTRGDYWVYDFAQNKLRQIGKKMPASSMMFAKFSPDGTNVAFVSNNNIYTENIETNELKQLTFDGTKTLINGTFDWVYEEEFSCRDGFRWSSDSRHIAFWQVDAGTIPSFYMINNTDSTYSRLIPVEYPKAGVKPSVCKVKIVSVETGKTIDISLPGEPDQNYIVRMEFIPGTEKLLIQQLNRKQNHSKLYIANSITGKSELFREETDEAWIDLYQPGNTYSIDYSNKFIWYGENKGIIWPSEKDGWRHFYLILFEKPGETLITKGDHDVIELKYTDEKNEIVYYTASPQNATQKYLFKSKFRSNAQLLSPDQLKGTHDYNISPNGKFAAHSFSNNYTKPAKEFLSFPDCNPLKSEESILYRLKSLEEKPELEFFKIKTSDGIEMDAMMIKPYDFDPTKKYPVVFYVYTEPASATVSDTYGSGQNFLYAGNMAEDGYIQISVDNRGTPVPKGRIWRKSIYRKLGQLNISDQANAAKEILKWDFVDPERIAVWGWSGGGTATLNLMFQYPEIYKTGIAIAPLTDLTLYDNIYQERFMGLPQENKQDYIDGSPVKYAKDLEGNLLLVHGTGDDNVHYQNSELLINELVKYGKIFQFMPYPNRTHNISEGPGTFEHLVKLYTMYIREKCPPGGK
ncbi:MAG: DPP IV N-terminal domain-containing protein [Deltaproteobacteria bacterium]